MTTFNLENKITIKELAPSLQAILNNKATITQYNTCNGIVSKLSGQLGDNRITVTNNTGNVASPQNNKEVLLLTTNNIFYSYSNGWIPTGGVYS